MQIRILKDKWEEETELRPHTSSLLVSIGCLVFEVDHVT